MQERAKQRFGNKSQKLISSSLQKHPMSLITDWQLTEWTSRSEVSRHFHSIFTVRLFSSSSVHRKRAYSAIWSIKHSTNVVLNFSAAVRLKNATYGLFLNSDYERNALVKDFCRDILFWLASERDLWVEYSGGFVNAFELTKRSIGTSRHTLWSSEMHAQKQRFAFRIKEKNWMKNSRSINHQEAHSNLSLLFYPEKILSCLTRNNKLQHRTESLQKMLRLRNASPKLFNIPVPNPDNRHRSAITYPFPASLIKTTWKTATIAVFFMRK